MTIRRIVVFQGDAMIHTHYTPFTLSLELEKAARYPSTVLHSRLTNCPQCRRALEELDHWLQVLDHCDPLVGPEFVTRHQFFKRLLCDHRTHRHRLRAIRRNELFHQWGLWRLLLQESAGARSASTDLAVELAELALEVALRLDPLYYRARRVADARAQAAATLADTLRLLGRTLEAAEHFSKAKGWLTEGTDRARIANRLARIEARFLRDMGQDKAAHELLKRASTVDAERQNETQNLLYWLREPRGRDLEIHEKGSSDPGSKSG